MVAHLKEEIFSAQNIDETGIVMIENGKFIVPSEANG